MTATECQQTKQFERQQPNVNRRNSLNDSNRMSTDETVWTTKYQYQ